MYKDWSSLNEAIMVVMKGWPATEARVFRSLRTCSTCFNLITASSAHRSRCPKSRSTTIRLAQYFQRIHPILALVAFQPDQPYTSKCT